MNIEEEIQNRLLTIEECQKAITEKQAKIKLVNAEIKKLQKLLTKLKEVIQ